MSDTATSSNSSAGVHWDLSSLFPSEAAAQDALAAALADSQSFRERYRGHVGELDAEGLATALAALSELDNRLSRIGSYAGLALSINISGEAERDVNAAVEQGMVEAQNALRFFELEWLAVDDARAAELAASPMVEKDRHYLESMRRFRPHTRSESEEDMLAEREPAAIGAWHTLFDQVLSSLQIPFQGRERTLDETLAFVRDDRRETRIAAYEAVFEALEPHTPVLAHVYDTLVGDRLVMDRVRSYGGPREARDLSNELPPAAVDAMLSAIEDAYPLAHRWWRRKARILGLDRLVLADQYAPMGEGRRVDWGEATGTVRDALERFDPRIEQIAGDLLSEGRMDAEPRKGKRGGAFCASVAQDARPFILMNFTEKLDDVMTLAHELGHGMNFELSGRRQTALSHHAPLALAEVPSTFAELIVFDRLLEEERDPATRRLLLAQKIEGSFATVFRQTLMVRYEQNAYDLRATGKALLPDRLSELWFDANKPYYGDAVELPEGYRLGWSYIPHFIHTRFYTYAYAFALLASLALYGKYRADRTAFVGDYLDFLATGASASPAEQLRAMGHDVERADAWKAGFDELERLIAMAEQDD